MNALEEITFEMHYERKRASLVAQTIKNPPALWETGVRSLSRTSLGWKCFPGGASGKDASAGDGRDIGSIPESGRSHEGGHGNPLQYSCLENPMDRGAWQATVVGVAKSQMWLKRLTMHAHMSTITFDIYFILLLKIY